MLLKNMKNKHQIYIDIDDKIKKQYPDLDSFLKKILEIALDYIKSTEKNDFFEVSLSIVNDEKIKEINNAYRSKNKPTDVLSFSQLEGEEIPRVEDEPIVLGDIIISYETCQKQAINYNHSFYAELLRLIVHGLYHLLGYDHERSKEEEKIMFQKEKEMIQYINNQNHL